MVKKLLFLMSAEQAETFARLVEEVNRGDGGAACRLGDMYREGLGGLRYSPKETYRWYARSAMAGDANGQNNLGACYEHGLGCGQSYAKAVKWYRLSAAQSLGTASMNLGYCYLRGKGLPADKGEALRLFRLAVEQGEPKAQPEVERLESSVTYGRIPNGFKDRTKDGGGLALIGGGGLQCSEPGADGASKVQFFDITEPGRHIGMIGPVVMAPPAVRAGTEPGTAKPEGVMEARMTPEMVPLGQLLPGFDETRVLKDSLEALNAGFDEFRKRTRERPYIVTTFRSSIDIDAFPTDSIKIGEAFADEEEAAAEAVRLHDEICNGFLSDVSSPPSDNWRIVGSELPAVMGRSEAAKEPRSDLRVVKSCMTKLKRGWYDIEYVSVVAFELPSGVDPVAAVLGEVYFRAYRDELLGWFEKQGRESLGKAV